MTIPHWASFKPYQLGVRLFAPTSEEAQRAFADAFFHPVVQATLFDKHGVRGVHGVQATDDGVYIARKRWYGRRGSQGKRSKTVI